LLRCAAFSLRCSIATVVDLPGRKPCCLSEGSSCWWKRVDILVAISLSSNLPTMKSRHWSVELRATSVPFRSFWDGDQVSHYPYPWEHPSREAAVHRIQYFLGEHSSGALKKLHLDHVGSRALSSRQSFDCSAELFHAELCSVFDVRERLHVPSDRGLFRRVRTFLVLGWVGCQHRFCG
jgi:hypothetical protein